MIIIAEWSVDVMSDVMSDVMHAHTLCPPLRPIPLCEPYSASRLPLESVGTYHYMLFSNS